MPVWSRFFGGYLLCAVVSAILICNSGCQHSGTANHIAWKPPVAPPAGYETNKIVVRAVRGDLAELLEEKGTWLPLKVGSELGTGSIVRTGPNVSLDLFLGANGPVLRLTESSLLEVEKLFVNKGADETIIQTSLNLRKGRLLGNVKKMAANSVYQIKVPQANITIRGTEFDVSATGVIHIVSGVAVVNYQGKIFEVTEGQSATIW